jgi:hypothetical protein
MKGYLPLLLLFVPFYLDAQLKDYIPQQPLQGAVAAKNYKQYILAHKIKSVTKWKVDTISKVPKKDHYLSFTNTGDTAQVVCWKKITIYGLIPSFPGSRKNTAMWGSNPWQSQRNT